MRISPVRVFCPAQVRSVRLRAHLLIDCSHSQAPISPGRAYQSSHTARQTDSQLRRSQLSARTQSIDRSIHRYTISLAAHLRCAERQCRKDARRLSGRYNQPAEPPARRHCWRTEAATSEQPMITVKSLAYYALRWCRATTRDDWSSR